MMRSLLFSAALSLAACAAAPPAVVHPERGFQIDDADALARQGIAAIDAGRFDEAVAIFDRLLARDPANLGYAYEKAFAFYLKGDHAAAIRLLEPLREGESHPRVFQLLGNAYDVTGDPERAVAVYQEGIRRFPSVGFLHYDLGVCLSASQGAAAALAAFLAGLRADPTYAKNHAMVARLYAEREPVLAVVHAESLLALAPDHELAAEMSQLLVRMYTRMIAESRAHEIHLDQDDAFVVLFRTTLLALLVIDERPADSIADVVALRHEMLQQWVTAEETHEVPAIIGWQARVAAAGHFEAYSHWLLGMGDGSYAAWCRDAHAAQCNGWADWFRGNDYAGG
jgi:tetratricopeptide (TPR) repeat protein